MRGIVFITGMDAEYGFRIAGVSQRAVRPEDALDALKDAAGNPDIGLIALDERLASRIGTDALKEIEKDFGGVLTAIPSPEIPGVSAEDYGLAFIQRIIGYHVKVSA